MGNRKCIFCGRQNNLSNEHVVPKWLQEELAIGHDKVLSIKGKEDIIEAVRKPTFNKLQNGHVCMICNNGWMSALEVENQEIIMNLMHRRNLESELNRLYNKSSLPFAKWAFKTAILIDHTSSRNHMVPDTHFQELYSGEIPEGVIIEIAFTDDVTPIQWRGDDYVLHQKVVPEDVPAYTIVLQIKHLLICVRFNPESDISNEENHMFEVFPGCGLKGEYRYYDSIDELRVHLS